MKHLILILLTFTLSFSVSAQERLNSNIFSGIAQQRHNEAPLTHSQTNAIRGLHTGRTTSPAGATSRWYEYFNYMDTSTGGSTANGTGTSAIYLWNDTSSTDMYSSAGITTLENNTMVSIGTVIDPYFNQFNNPYYDSSITTGYNGVFLSHWPTKNYVVDSITIYGMYGVNPAKTSVVDTITIGYTYGTGTGSSDISDVYFTDAGAASVLFTDYSIPTTDSMWFDYFEYDSVTNTGMGTNFHEQIITLSNTGAVTNSHDTWYDTLPGGIFSKTIALNTPLSVPAGNIVGVTVSFKSGDPTHTFGDTVFTGDPGQPYRYNMFRPLVAWYSNGSTSSPTPIFPTYPKVPPSLTAYPNAATTVLSGTDFNEGLFKILPNYWNGWDGVYTPQWAWTSGGTGTAASDYQYPIVDIHVKCASCTTTPFPGSITGATSVCPGSTTTLSDATPGGVWSSSNTSIATISATGVVYGITLGTSNISYTVSGSAAGTTITVTNTTSPGTISGTATVYAGGGTATLNETVSGGTWSSSNTTVATIDPSTGVYTGVTVGTSVITYTVSGCGGVADTTYTVTVTAINGISGYVNFAGSPYTGNLKVWLITYSTSAMDLQAIDSSSISCSSSSSVYYQFVGPITDSYRVKAAVVYTPTVTTGYIPTYHTSSFYWYAANVIYHTSGTADINEDINMAYGTVTSGPGFIAGNVTAGANRGTSTGIPVVGLSVNLLNSTTTQLMQSTTTDINGNYSFSDLPAGTYYVFPDSLNYLTTPYTDITLSTGSDSMTAANFIQHTISKTITPGTTSIPAITNTHTIDLYPNPAHDQLTITSTDNITNVLITNLVGQTVYIHDYNTQQVQVSVANLPAGVYFVKANGTDVRKFVKE